MAAVDLAHVLVAAPGRQTVRTTEARTTVASEVREQADFERLVFARRTKAAVVDLMSNLLQPLEPVTAVVAVDSAAREMCFDAMLDFGSNLLEYYVCAFVAAEADYLAGMADLY